MSTQFSKPPIIIGGCGRSGTTLLLSVLSAHTNIFSIPEETQIFCPTAYNKKPNFLAPFTIDPLYEVLANSTIPPTCTRWCEKTPKNILFFDRILEYFGQNVRLIQIVRDGRDVITSIHPKNKKAFWISPQRWVDEVMMGLKYTNHSQVLTIRYEDLIQRFELTISKICQFLGEECNARILSWHNYAAIRQNTAWFGEVEPLHKKSIGRWKQKKFKKRIKQLIKIPEADKLLKHYCYES